MLAALVWLPGCRQESPTEGTKQEAPRRAYPLSSLKTSQVKIGRHRWTVWVMDDEDKRREGLMHVKASELPDGRGMLFVFSDAKPRSFWMKNTEVALDIAFFGSDRQLLNVQRGIPFDEESLPSKGAAQYVLEVREGTFEKLGIKEGANLELFEPLDAMRP